MDVLIEPGAFQKNEVATKSDKPNSDIRFINDFKRHLSSNSDSDNSQSHLIVGGANQALAESLDSSPAIEYKDRNAETFITDLGSKYQNSDRVGKIYSSHKEAVLAGLSNSKSFDNKVAKDIEKSQVRSQADYKKPPEQETGLKFSLLGNGKSILAIRSYKTNSAGLINWIGSKFGYSLDSIIVNGKKILTTFEGR
ncbi:MAG: hypothetical protein RPT25_04475 [Cycloclasticus sp.]